MKRLLLLFTIFFFFLSGSAQGFFDIGVHMGYHSSKFVTDLDHYKSSEMKGISGGVFLRMGANHKLFVQPECYLASKGGAFSFDGLPGDPLTPALQLDDAELKIRLTTVDMPLLLGFHLLKFEHSNLRIMAGPVISWVIDENVSLSASGVDHSSDLPPLLFKDKAWSFQYGAGIDIWKLSFNFRHEVSVQNLSAIGGFMQKGSLYFASIGYKFL